MPAPAEVSARPAAGPGGADGEGAGPLRVRPPSPLPRGRRIALAVAVVVVFGVAMVLVQQARSADGPLIPGAAWRGVPVPRSALVDEFERPGLLGEVEGFGRWQVEGGGLAVVDGVVRSDGDGGAVATVDAGSADVLVHAQVVRMAPGSGLLFSASAAGVPGLVLEATGSDGWDLVWHRSGPAPDVLQSLPAPTKDVSVQLVRRGDRVRVAFDELVYEVEVPAEAGGTFVGLWTDGPGTELDLFGYLPLDPG